MLRSLTAKLVLVVVVIVILLLAIITLFNYKNTSKNTVELYESLQQLALNSSYTTINITMNIEAQQHLRFIANHLENTNKNDVLAQRSLLRDTADLIHYVSVYVVYDSDGKTLTENYGDSNPLSDQWDAIHDLRGRDWYVDTKKANAPIVTRTYISQGEVSKGKMIATATYPLHKNGKFYGVIGLDIVVEEFQARFQNFKRPELPSLNIFITDTTGTIFSHEDPKIIANATPLPAETTLKQALAQGNKEGKISFSNDGKSTRVAYYKQFPFGWTIVAAASMDDYTNAVNRTFLQASLIAVVLMILGSTILYFIIRFYLSPIPKIKDFLFRFFQYLNYETKTAPEPLIIKSKDELGQMGLAINENIQQTKIGLEQDAKAVEQSVETAKTIEQGDFRARITEKPHNPQLNELKNVLNHMLDDLQHKIGSDTNEIARVFDSYTKLDFTTEVKDANGRVEVVTNTLGQEIRKMLQTNSDFAHTLSHESQSLQEAVN
ncbi:methyl-accepting chemotaxis protein, partial [Helicobacter marmotae]